MLPSDVVLGLNVYDPRLVSISQTKKPEFPSTGAIDPSVLTHWPNDVSQSEIWSSKKRKEVLKGQPSIKDLCRRREKLLIPGDELLPTESDSVVPIILVQFAGKTGSSKEKSCCLGYGAGWDIIIPSGWAMAFWLPLVLAGCRAIGLNERRAFCLELAMPCEPFDFPDTTAYENNMDVVAQEEKSKHERKPPKHRVNFVKLGVKSPFKTDWHELIRNCNTNCSEANLPTLKKQEISPCVIRHAEKISKLQEFVLSDSNVFQLQSCENLVAVRLQVCFRGSPQPRAMIYAPLDEDFQKYKEKTSPVYHQKDPTSKDRETGMIGALTTANFSFSRGFGFGLGCVSLSGLVSCCVKQKSQRCEDLSPGAILVLVRNTTSLQYNFGTISLLM
eukprot:m.208183 g.208183  ORF g.208183 m.208183 type:complete len:388 (-) comp15807_c3_seq5:850-2013(-)